MIHSAIPGLIARNALFVVNHSGGKDSQAMYLKIAALVPREQNAITGKHGLDTVKGLGRNFAWADLANANAAEIEDGAEQLRP